jgi:hypothetical protein
VNKEVHRKNVHFKAIITNNHIDPITNQLNRFNTKDEDEEEIKTIEYYNVKPSKNKQELFIYKKEELLNIEFDKKKYYTVYYGGDLTEVLKWLKYTLKYHPSIKYTTSLSNIFLKINESIINLTNHDITLNDANTEIRIKEGKTKIEYMKLFKKLDNEFMDNLLCKQYMSTYSESLQYNLFNFPISCATGYLKKTVSKYTLDFVYAYSSILY